MTSCPAVLATIAIHCSIMNYTPHLVQHHHTHKLAIIRLWVYIILVNLINTVKLLLSCVLSSILINLLLLGNWVSWAHSHLCARPHNLTVLFI